MGDIEENSAERESTSPIYHEVDSPSCDEDDIVAGIPLVIFDNSPSFDDTITVSKTVECVFGMRDSADGEERESDEVESEEESERLRRLEEDALIDEFVLSIHLDDEEVAELRGEIEIAGEGLVDKLFRGDAKDLEQSILRALQCLSLQRDLTWRKASRTCLNETGFKAMVVALIVAALGEGEVEVVSEYEVTDAHGVPRFIDVLLKRGRKAVVLELKYIPEPFASVDTLTGVETLCSFVRPGSKAVTASVDVWLQHWMDHQAKRYARCLRFPLQQIEGEGLVIERVKTIVLCGYGQKVKSLVR